MKFLVDAHLPRRLAALLRAAGHDAIHTLDLPNQNRTTDQELLTLADRNGRVVVSKDADFVQSYTLLRRPRKLLLISTGNITNKQLEALVIPNLPKLVTALETHHFVELSRNLLIMHDQSDGQALQLQDAISPSHLSKTQLADALHTSRSQLDRLLDPDYTALTLDSLERLALVLGKQLRIELA